MISSLLANGLRMTFKFSLSYSALQKKSHILSYDILWSCTAQQARSHGFSVTPPPRAGVCVCVCVWVEGGLSVCVWVITTHSLESLWGNSKLCFKRISHDGDKNGTTGVTQPRVCDARPHTHAVIHFISTSHEDGCMRNTLSCCQFKTDLNNNKIGTISNVCHFSGLLVQPVKQHPSANTWTGLRLVSVLYSWN